MTFPQFRMAARLSAAFAVLTLITLTVMAVGILRMQGLRDATNQITSNWLPSVEVINQINTATSDIRVGELSHVLQTTEEGMGAVERELAALLNDLDRYRKEYAQLISSTEEQRLYDSFDRNWSAYLKKHDEALALSRQNKNEEARDLLNGDAKKLYGELSRELIELVDLNHKGSVQAAEQSNAAFSQGLIVLGSVAAISVLVSAVLAWRITRSITIPLAEAVTMSQAVAQGDLTRQAAVHRQDEIGDLMRSMNDMTRNLARLVADVRQGTDAIATASTQIAQGNADLSARTEQQAASLQETAASMHQMTQTVRANSDNASQANQLVAQATQVATRGGDDVAQVVSTMAAIQDSSRRIADIISVIDGIAFQTNILALNAAVEAARAGEQGRGFAVVASEVRSLAQRSANAAKEIKSLITDSVEKVEIGNQQVNSAGQTIQEVVLQVRKVNDLIAEITSSSTEQSTGIGQINQAVGQLDQATQQNAALVEETSAAAESLRNQANGLSRAVSVFRVQA